jgi:hypothetical protein
MISDVLHETVTGIDHYLTSPTFDGMYSGRLRGQINKLRDEALYHVMMLDAHPAFRDLTKKQALAMIAEKRIQTPRASS